MTWTPETVFARLVEAFEVIAGTVARDGHKPLLSGWPEEAQGSGLKVRRLFAPEEIARAEEAIAWFSIIEDSLSRKALQWRVMCVVTNAKFSQFCEKIGEKRTTMIYRNDVELKRICKKLNLDGVAIRLAGARHVRQNGRKSTPNKGNSEKCATHWRGFEPGTFDPENFDPSWAQKQAEKRRRKKLGLEVEEENALG